MSPRWYALQRGVSLSTRTYWPGSSVDSIEVCLTWNGCATNVWMTKNAISVNASVSTTSMSQRGGRRVTRAVCP